jgi:hypothetical protein
MDTEVIKILLVGDEKCGKTTFLSYAVLTRLLNLALSSSHPRSSF